jgi:murein DD-endopeptidase MepM/ murein hydrolase activator NlpD
VASIGSRGPLGNSLVVDHGFGVKTFYGHTQRIYVKVGESIERGQKIASIGSTGRSTGPHLHYAIHVNGKARDPLNYIFD